MLNLFLVLIHEENGMFNFDMLLVRYAFSVGAIEKMRCYIFIAYSFYGTFLIIEIGKFVFALSFVGLQP